jgi:TRAP-type C4-dicarboxylate transport system substrate-binding protein
VRELRLRQWEILNLREVKSLRKGVLFVFLAFTLVAMPVFGSCAAPAPGEKIELTYSNFFPPAHFHSVLAEQFCQEIEERTDGRVEITYYPGGSLTPAPGVYDGVVQGISDIGMSVLAYSMGRFPASELVDLPHAYPNGWVATKVANDFYEKFKPAEFDDVHVLYFHAHGPGVVFTTKKPVRQMEDLEGLVIRSTGVGAKIMEALGAKGYGASQGEAYELMSKGTIDGSFTPREVLKGWKQAEVVKCVTGCYDVGNTTNMFVVMNKDKWDSLPGDIKKVFTKVSTEWIEKHGKVWTYYDKIGMDYFLTFEGRELIELSPEEMARWVEATKPLMDEYIDEKTAMGLPAADYDEYLIQRVGYWAKKSPTEESCVEWVEKELAQ